MEKTILQESQLYTRALYPRRRGCPLWVPEPNEDLPAEYHEIGVQMGDVGVLTDDGGFDFVFNACRSSSDPINQGGVPDGFQPLTIGRTFSTHTHSHFFPPDHLVLSAGAKRRALDIEAMAHPLPGIPVGAGAGFSINFAKDQGAAIYLPNGANSVDARNQRVFCEYAKRNAESWYRFMYETLGMDVENGDIYFITGFDKTDCWENTVYANSMKEQKYEILFSTGGFTGADGCFRLSSSSLYGTFSRRRSPLHNSNHNQALFIRGFRVSIARGIRSFLGGSAVEVTNTNKSSMSGVFGKKGPYPFGRGRSYTSSSESSSSPGPHGSSEGSSLAWSLSGNGNDSDTSMEEDDIIESSKLYHPSRILNNYLIRSTIGDDVSVVITHDEDWVALLTEEDLEMPDDSTLIERAESLFRITVNNGTLMLLSP
ncbi:hypothetical protein L218DRAFT_893714 [Marasmius fiardii PR-910]|nr:hypothetical protein L218DRAFT_893714 [Marasmius fiardii PR-910]